MSHMTGARGVARILGGKAVLKREVRSLGDLQRRVANGLPVRALDRTVEYIASSPREAVRLRDRLVPPATRKRRKQRLKPAESERVERVARVMGPGEEVWESAGHARPGSTTRHTPLAGAPRPPVRAERLAQSGAPRLGTPPRRAARAGHVGRAAVAKPPVMSPLPPAQLPRPNRTIASAYGSGRSRPSRCPAFSIMCTRALGIFSPRPEERRVGKG